MAYVALSRAQSGFARIMSEHGNAMTLKRSGESNLTVMGKRLLLRIGEEAVGNGQQTRFRIKIATTELAASAWASKVPKFGDSIVVDGRECTLLGVWPMQDATATVGYELEVAG